MSRLLTQIRKLEAKRATAAKEAADLDKMLFITFFLYNQSAAPRRLVPGPGEEVATDAYVKVAHWARNYCFLDGELRDRITKDPRDFGTIYDAREWHKARAWGGPLHGDESDVCEAELPILGTRVDEVGGVRPSAAAGNVYDGEGLTVRNLAEVEWEGLINPFDVEHWPGVHRVDPRRKWRTRRQGGTD